MPSETSLFHRGVFPREGFHADVLGSLLKKTALNPLLTLPLFVALRYTDVGQDYAARYVRANKWLGVLAALGTIRVLNNWLGRRALNNGVSDTYDWQNREVVVVTGGSDGIGARITLMLAEKGIKVAVLDVQPLTFSPPKTVRFYECDITSTNAVVEIANKIRSDLGTPTVLINNAGVCRGKPLLDTTDADLALTFNVNTVAHYKLTRELLPAMIKADHGMVVTVASSAAWVTAPRMTEYAASKAAALAFHEGLGAELIATYKAPRVRTVVVNQGYTKTKLFQGFDVSDSAFFGPALHVDTVAEAIAQQVLSGQSGQIIVPGFYKLLVQHFRTLPAWMSHGARCQMGNLMAAWNGRQVTAGNLEKS